jgi:hypothetical protein
LQMLLSTSPSLQPAALYAWYVVKDDEIPHLSNILALDDAKEMVPPPLILSPGTS